jgi:hypothetical protein
MTNTDLPEGGLAAASTLVRLLSMVVMPALAMEMVCCSMACSMGTESWEEIVRRASKRPVCMAGHWLLVRRIWAATPLQPLMKL